MHAVIYFIVFFIIHCDYLDLVSETEQNHDEQTENEQTENKQTRYNIYVETQSDEEVPDHC